TGNAVNITGTPTAAVTNFSASVTVTDTAGVQALNDFSITINPPIAFALAPSLPASTIGVAYTQILTASGGTGAKTMSVSNFNNGGTGLAAPTPAPGTLTFNSTPTTAGTVSFDLTATDTVGATATQHYSFTINGALTLSPTALPGAVVGLLYNQTITAAGGTGTKTLSVSNVTGGI